MTINTTALSSGKELKNTIKTTLREDKNFAVNHQKETHSIPHKPKKMSQCEKDLEELRETFKSGKTREESWRRTQLKNLLRLLEEKEDDIFKALKQDLGKHHVEAYRDEVIYFLCSSSRSKISDVFFTFSRVNLTT